MNTDEVLIRQFHERLTERIYPLPLGVAARVLYYDAALRCFILAMHTTGPEKTQEATRIALDAIRGDLLQELEEARLGFAGQQI